jgi:hypothetical protein
MVRHSRVRVRIVVEQHADRLRSQLRNLAISQATATLDYTSLVSELISVCIDDMHSTITTSIIVESCRDLVIDRVLKLRTVKAQDLVSCTSSTFCNRLCDGSLGTDSRTLY